MCVRKPSVEQQYCKRTLRICMFSHLCVLLWTAVRSVLRYLLRNCFVFVCFCMLHLMLTNKESPERDAHAHIPPRHLSCPCLVLSAEAGLQCHASFKLLSQCVKRWCVFSTSLLTFTSAQSWPCLRLSFLVLTRAAHTALCAFIKFSALHPFCTAYP